MAFGVCRAADWAVGTGCDTGAVEVAGAPRRGGHDGIGTAEAARLGSEYGASGAFAARPMLTATTVAPATATTAAHDGRTRATVM